MPIEVNVEERLRSIAEATFAVAERDGAHAVSYRSIAKELGGSTAMVSNYLPTRAALLQNAVRHISVEWNREVDEVIEAAPKGKALVAVAKWSCTTASKDLVFRRMFIHALVESSERDGVQELAAAETDAHREMLMAAAKRDGRRNPGALADALLLVAYGYYLATIEDLETWPQSRVATAIDAICR